MLKKVSYIFVFVLLFFSLLTQKTYALFSTSSNPPVITRVGNASGNNILNPDIPTGWPLKAPVERCSVTQVPGGGFSHGSLNAVDLSLANGTPIYSTLNGKITTKHVYLYNCYQSGCRGEGYGTYVVVTNGNAWAKFAHLIPDSISHLQEGQIVQRGDLIGKSDNTGYSSGPHLHYEIPWNLSDRAPFYRSFKRPSRRDIGVKNI
ncbi:M23 family metallopeptidase, partial [Patescibacteria group bacterium]|nr:M23 family metallopeptidase [Patescibacteria group bacterium]